MRNDSVGWRKQRHGIIELCQEYIEITPIYIIEFMVKLFYEIIN